MDYIGTSTEFSPDFLRKTLRYWCFTEMLPFRFCSLTLLHSEQAKPTNDFIFSKRRIEEDIIFPKFTEEVHGFHRMVEWMKASMGYSVKDEKA